MKLLYIFLLSFVVGSRRLSGYYNKICSICIINLPPVNSQGVILQYFFTCILDIWILYWL